MRRSTPCRWRLATGTPSTGTTVLAASMPGRCAAPPAPAMMARRPRACALRRRRTCRPASVADHAPRAARRTAPGICTACCRVSQSLLEPITTPTRGVVITLLAQWLVIPDFARRYPHDRRHRSKLRSRGHRRLDAYPRAGGLPGRPGAALQDAGADPEQLEVEYAGRFKLVKIDSDQQQSWPAPSGIRSIPTCIPAEERPAGGRLHGRAAGRTGAPVPWTSTCPARARWPPRPSWTRPRPCWKPATPRPRWQAGRRAGAGPGQRRRPRRLRAC